MKVKISEIKDFIEGAEALEDDHQNFVDAEPEVKKHLDAARNYAKMRYTHVTEPMPADPRYL